MKTSSKIGSIESVHHKNIAIYSLDTAPLIWQRQVEQHSLTKNSRNLSLHLQIEK